MEFNNTLLIPHGSTTYILGYLGLFLVLPISLCFVIFTGSLSIGFFVILVIALVSFSILHIYEYNKENLSLTIYWGFGLPVGNLFIKLPLVKQNFPGKRISKIGIFHRVESDDTGGVANSYSDTYIIKAMVGGKWINIGGAVRQSPIPLQDSRKTAIKISDFLGVPIVDKNS
jgi:hypothetical protein